MSEGVVHDTQTVALRPGATLGIDVYYRADAAPFDGIDATQRETFDGVDYHYVIMQDLPLFAEAHPFDPETLTSSVAYTFPMGASTDSPTESPAGCLMTVVVDFEATGAALETKAAL